MADHPAQNLPPELSGCPTPLVWDEVVRSVLEGSRECVLEMDGASLTWMEFGTGKPLLVLPNFLGTPRVFALTAWLLRDHFRSIMLAHPQWTRPPAARHLVADTATIVEKLLPALCQNGAVLYGSGYGVQVALELLCRQPHFMETAILQSGWAQKPLTLFERSMFRLGTWLTGSVRRVPLWLSVQIANHRPWFPPFDETRFRLQLQEAAHLRICDTSRRLLAAFQTDLRPGLGSISTPLMMIRTEGDGTQISRLQDEYKVQLPAGLPVREEWLHTCGQLPFLTHPHRLAKLILSSISKQ